MGEKPDTGRFCPLNIRIEMTRKGYGQEALAKRAGLSQAGIGNILRGKDFRVSTLCKIARALGVSERDLFLDPSSSGLVG